MTKYTRIPVVDGTFSLQECFITVDKSLDLIGEIFTSNPVAHSTKILHITLLVQWPRGEVGEF